MIFDSIFATPCRLVSRSGSNQRRNVGTVSPATPEAPLRGGAKWHAYLFSNIRLKDGRRTKNCRERQKSGRSAKKSGEQKKRKK